MEHFRKILLVDSGRKSGAAARRRAVDLALRNGAQLTLACVREDSREPLPAVDGIDSARLRRLIDRERRKGLNRRVQSLSAKGIRVSGKELSGSVAIEIVREALRGGHDLVVTPAAGENRLREALFGSVELQLMRKCPCPVWVVKASRRGRYLRVLAAIDPEAPRPLNRKIIDLALTLAKQEDSELHIVSVWRLYGETELRSFLLDVRRPELNRLLQQARAHSGRVLLDLLSEFRFDGLRRHIHLLHGRASERITELARSSNIDCIVMGTVSRTGIAGLLMGNTAESVLRGVNCSVLTVKPDSFVSPVSPAERGKTTRSKAGGDTRHS